MKDKSSLLNFLCQVLFLESLLFILHSSNFTVSTPSSSSFPSHTFSFLLSSSLLSTSIHHLVRYDHLFFAEGTMEREQQAKTKTTSHVRSCLRQDMKGHHGDMSIHSQRGWAHTDGKLEGAACFQTKNKSL